LCPLDANHATGLRLIVSDGPREMPGNRIRLIAVRGLMVRDASQDDAPHQEG